MADERLPCRRSWSIAATMSDKVKSRFAAISFNPAHNPFSRLTLVLCPAMTMERLTTGDFIGFSCLDTVFVELAADLRGFRLGERTVSLRHTVGNPGLGGALVFTSAIGPLPGSAEIDDLGHARSLRSQTKGQQPLPSRLV